MCPPGLLNRWLNNTPDDRAEEMVQVTLEQIQTFSLNARVTRNPGYDALKASIRARGLDNPPVLTRRPGDEKYMLASGGNTRLAVLNELWQETHEARFHHFCWPYRPWPQDVSLQQGELQCLIGHLAESDLHTGLTFIERAEGCLRLRALYLEAGIPCPSQQALAEQLTRDGYPVTQSKISRMVQTIDWLRPCIPDALYAGLTRAVIERLLALRSAAEQAWCQLVSPEQEADFTSLFSKALSTFDGEPEGVVPPLVQDELLGEMSRHSGIAYNTFLAELTDSQSKRQALLGPPVEKVLWPPPPEPEKPVKDGRVSETDNRTTAQDSNPERENIQDAQPENPLPAVLKAKITAAAREICEIWELDDCLIPDDQAVMGFTTRPCQHFIHPAAQNCYRVMAALSGAPVIPVPMLDLLLSPECSDEQLRQLFRLVNLCRRLKTGDEGNHDDTFH